MQLDILDNTFGWDDFRNELQMTRQATVEIRGGFCVHFASCDNSKITHGNSNYYPGLSSFQ